MPDGITTMRASQNLLNELHQRKQRGESYEDVIWRLIEDNSSNARVTVFNPMNRDVLIEVGGVRGKLRPEQEIYIRPKDGGCRE